ncbi:hypothetical protein ACOMHN_024034 [Nucella lapillus]
MEPSGDKFVDHKETTIRAPKPRQLNVHKVDITPEEVVQGADNFEAGFGSVLTKVQLSVLKSDKGKTSEDKSDAQETSSKRESESESVTLFVDGKSVVMQESVSKSSESSPSTKMEKKLYATSVYTQRIGGRKSRSSDSGNEISSPTVETSRCASWLASTSPPGVDSPSKVCSVQFNVAAGVGSSTTTAFSKMFTKTVDANMDVSTKECHLSECSFSMGGSADKLPSQETDLNHSQETADHDNVFTQVFTTSKPEEEKEVAEYCPGLAIRTLTLENLQEKRLTPERDLGLNSTPVQQSTHVSTSLLASQPPAVSQDKGLFSSYADSPVDGISMPVDMAQKSVAASEYNTSELPASESSTSISMASQPSSLTSGGQILMQCTDDAPTSLRKPFFNPIEVERKFTLTGNTEEQLKSLGARLHKEKSFTDVYYDNDEFSIIVSDCWLRRRNDSWEAKVPLTPQKAGAIFSPASQYKEISNEREISRWLVDHLGMDRWMRGDPVDLLVQAAGLAEFAKFNTTRRSYTLPSCMVDLDLTDNGFQVGEIDVMAASPEELPQALQTISNVAAQLGVKAESQCPDHTVLDLVLLNLRVFNLG